MNVESQPGYYSFARREEKIRDAEDSVPPDYGLRARTLVCGILEMESRPRHNDTAVAPYHGKTFNMP